MNVATLFISIRHENGFEYMNLLILYLPRTACALQSAHTHPNAKTQARARNPPTCRACRARRAFSSEVLVSFCIEREFSEKQWGSLQESLVDWRDSIRGLLQVVQTARPQA